jgi:ATP-dependent DNA helicase RecQ
MQLFVSMLRERRSDLLSLKELVALHNQLPRSKWSELILQGLMDLNRELASKSAPAPDIIEWLGEWSREMRGLQRGLMLLTAHRAKGLEFDHVIALDGGWSRLSKGEDVDAARRLFYVAMTRARQSFAAIAPGSHLFLDPKTNQDLLVRAPHIDPDACALCSKIYQATDPRMVDLSFAGRMSDHSASQSVIRQLNVGDEVHLIREGQRWCLKTPAGVTVGRMSRAYSPPDGAAFLSAEVGALLRWRKSDSSEEYQHMMRQDEWDVVLPELVFTK